MFQFVDNLNMFMPSKSEGRNYTVSEVEKDIARWNTDTV